MARRSTLKLGYVVMSASGRFLVDGDTWGAAEGNDMYDAQVFRSRSFAEKMLEKFDSAGSVFEIGVYNGRPVMLVDAYDYWMDAKYAYLKEK
jgi:CYTH domain-containing protein